MLQGAIHLTEVLSPLSDPSREALIAEVARFLAQDPTENLAGEVIRLYGEHVRGFEEAWGRLVSEGHSDSRLRIVERLARGEYT